MPRHRDSGKQNKKKIASLSALGASVRKTDSISTRIIGKKVASLSALGAGAILGAGAFMLDAPLAEAGGVHSGHPNVNLTPGGSHFSSFGVGGPALQFFVTSNGSNSSGSAQAKGFAGAGSKLAHYAGGTLRLFGKGAKWTTAGPLGNNGSFRVGGRFWSRTYPGFVKQGKFGGMKIGGARLGRVGKSKRRHGGIAPAGVGKLSSSYTPTSSPCCSSPSSSSGGVTNHGVFPKNQPFIDQYALFTFPNGPTTLYGWIELSLSIDDTFGPNGTPDLAVIAWAWDDSGAALPAGDTTPTPEPATEVATGLAALALGAEGLRRWRKARTAA